jgi:glycosyltransferase involved in cell wall biosynthesis
LVRRVDHSFFVSEELLNRARREYGAETGKTSVSMNATEKRFFPADGDTRPAPVPIQNVQRPVAGVIGGISVRLDFNLLKLCADLPELGMLLLAGPLPDNPPASLKRLLLHPKCKAVGAQPHASIHQWFRCLDVGLIPYTKSEFNRMCSPMRLFDHLASGTPVVATDSCSQVNDFADRIDVCADPESFVAAVHRHLSSKGGTRFGKNLEGIKWSDRASAMLSVMEDTARV